MKKESMETELVSVAAIAPFWRYAVGPKSDSSPAIPFYSFKAAEEFFEEARRDLPWAGVILYRRKGWSRIKTLKEYIPAEGERNP
jgi:hypothetical protein